jgi:hypothetical protein
MAAMDAERWLEAQAAAGDRDTSEEPAGVLASGKDE